MVNPDVADAMVDIFAKKHGISSREDARAQMMVDPKFSEMLSKDYSLGGITAAIQRDATLAHKGGRLNAIEAVIKPYLDAATSPESPFAVDLAAGTAMYTIAFAERWNHLSWFACDRHDPESGDTYPIGLHQTREALRVYAEEYQPKDIVPGLPGQRRRRLLFVSEGPPRCAVREGDVVTLRGLQSAPALNGRNGVALSRRADGERIGVRLLDGGKDESTEPKALKPANLEFNMPGWAHKQDAMKSDDEQMKAVQEELERLKGEVNALARLQAVRSVAAREADLLHESTWAGLLSEVGGKCAFVSCMSLLSQVGHETPLLWQKALKLAAALLAPGGVCLQYDTAKFGNFADVQAMAPVAQELGLELDARTEPIEYGDDRDGRFYALVWRRRFAVAVA